MQSTFDHPTPHDDAPKPNFWLTVAKFTALATIAALCLTYGGFIIAAAAGVTGLVALPLVTSIANLAFGWMAACVAGFFAIAGLSIYNSITTVRHYNESKSLKIAVESTTNTATDAAAFTENGDDLSTDDYRYNMFLESDAPAPVRPLPKSRPVAVAASTLGIFSEVPVTETSPTAEIGNHAP